MELPEVLFCDNHLLVLSKPAGMLTQPNHTSDVSLECFGKKWLKKKFCKPENVFLEAIHRLDRPVSGIVLFARTSKALSRLQLAQRNTQFKKSYAALIEGSLECDEGILEHYLIHDAFQARVVRRSTPRAKKCRLEYRVVQKTESYTLVVVSLLSGRYHQIRAQFGAIDCPILGDQKYGSEATLDKLALHHGYLLFPHPISQENLTWQAPLPPHWPAELHHSPIPYL